MPRARNKKQLLEFGEKEFVSLQEHVQKLSGDELTKKEIFTKRSVKDVIAHLIAWQNLFFTWYEDGMSGKKPDIPAVGFTFKDTPALNEKLYKAYKDVSWTEIWHQFKKSHYQMVKLIEKHTNEELTEKKKYAWTGTTNLASYFASATSSHYMWASGLLKKYLRTLQKI